MIDKRSDELRALDAELESIERRKAAILERRREILALKVAPGGVVQARSTQQKVELFSALFKGRKDVYALRWENQQGRSGYSVACANEWAKGLCNKPRVKCGECNNRAFRSLDEQAIYSHLSGKETLGLYPLQSDNKCFLLAVDFDKSDWQQAANAFRIACVELDIPCAVERSRSGNGAHVWIFFESAVPAQDARQLGFTILDKAMENHAVLSFESYDRLFPNQDTMPDGGFGNLIALPLQRIPRELNNSVFVDEEFIPYEDQWKFLASLRRLNPKRIAEFLERAVKDTNTVDEDVKPWERNLATPDKTIPACPDSLSIVLANRIYLPINSLPQPLIARLKRLASFSNPVFFKTQALRFSTNGIPRFICLAQIEEGYLSLPRGCLDGAYALLQEQNIKVIFDDKRRSGGKLAKLDFRGELRKEQKKAVAALSKHDVGVLHAPTAFGKTITAIGLIQKRKVNTLILVHSRQLLDQWKERLETFLGGAEIGVIGGGKRKPLGNIDIATYQSLIRRGDNTVDPLFFEYGQVIIDECHHISAPRYEMLLSETHAKYVLGVTATPQRQDGHQPIIFMQAGPIRYAAKSDVRHQFEQRVIVRQLYNTPPIELTMTDKRPHIADIYRWLAGSEARNKQIIDDVIVEAGRQRNPIILTERREHAVVLGELLDDEGITYQVLRGGMRVKEREAAMSNLKNAQVLIATGKYIGEGFDLPKLDTLFLALPISWKGSLAQYAGRIHRQIEGKDQVRIYDYVDESLPTLQRMYQRRSKGYDAMGYTVVDQGADGEQTQSQLGFT